MKSIRQQLLLWLLLGMSVTTVAAALTVYVQARVEARGLFDLQLQLMAETFPYGGWSIATAPPRSGAAAVDNVVVQVWDLSGTPLYLSRQGPPPPQSDDIGFATETNAQGEWRIYSTVVGDYVIQVSQPTSLREKLATNLAFRTMLPLLVLLPLLFMVVWLTVGNGLRPLMAVTAAVGRRSADALEPLADENLPAEVHPLVVALNDLLARLGHSLKLQRSFIADAAHELRTPLTAVRLQLQIVERATSDAERVRALADLKGGINRATRLIEQLLTLARYEPDVTRPPMAPVDLHELARQVVAERAPMAEAKGVDIGVSANGILSISANTDALHTLLGNLVDNAIHYTPAGGRIDVAVEGRGHDSLLIVTDTGPGIPAADRERVFDRFYRGGWATAPGSGLGLAIVREVARQHHASVSLDSGDNGVGLRVTVRFPGESPGG